MRHFILMALFSFGTLMSTAQADIQIIKIKNKDKAVSISAVNNSGVPYTLKINITLEGMELESPLPPFIKIFPGEEKHITTLTPIDTNPYYKIHYQATAIENGEKVTTEVMVPDLTIYTKNGDKKSTQLRQYLVKNEIPFTEVNVSYSDKTKQIYEKMLALRGIRKQEAKVPVLLIKGEIYYAIDDINQFIATKL
ncbi:MAG: hypothetical protein P1U56_21260 [Saprospiraceae bacterium]|nr:hypothetical protein [Saprospiraceae bacterium]